MKYSRATTLKPLKKFSSSDLPDVYEILLKHFGNQGWWPADTTFEMIVGAILTQNTSWKNVEKAIANLKKFKVLSPRKLNELSVQKLALLIRSAGFYNVKSVRIKNFLKFLFDKFGGDLKKMFASDTENLRKDLLSISGIGRETADCILLYAGGKLVFVIDAYTRRIFERHALNPVENALKGREHSYEVWRSLFEGAIKKDLTIYQDYHAQIVLLAKLFCKSSNPLCLKCPIYSNK